MKLRAVPHSPPNRWLASRCWLESLRVRITRAMGSATLSLTYLANGRFDVYVQWTKLSVWDICAAGVIALEGGATVTSALGNDWFGIGMPSKSIGIAAAMPEHHGTILRLLAED